MLFDIPKDVGFPEILVLSNIFSFPAVNWTPKWTKTENLHTFHLSQNSFLNTAIKIVEYLTHHLACEHWSKVQTKLKVLGSSEAKKSPKSSLR